MKLTKILIIGLIITAFAFNPWISWDLREFKTTLAVIFAIIIAGIQIYRNGIKPIDNKWFLMLLAYLPISLLFGNLPAITIHGENVSEFWFWKPFCYLIIFGIMAMAIASYEVSDKEIRKIFNVISWCGFLTAAYVIVQRIGADQFFYSTYSDTGKYAGFIGNPTLTAHYIAMTIPFTFYTKKWYFLPFMVASLIICDSLVAGAGLICGIAYLLATNIQRALIIGGIAITCVIAIVVLYPNHIKGREHERFDRWKQVVSDIKKPSFVTGRGIGSFQFFFRQQNPGEGDKVNRFKQAHNDYLEWFYGVGLIGFILSILAFFKFAKEAFFRPSNRTRVVLSSLVMLLIICTACFDLQVGTTMFFASLLAGLLMNKGFLCRY